MRRLVILLILAYLPWPGGGSGVAAQEAPSGLPDPVVEVELSETEVIPGQPTVMRVTVLVPTWLPKPVAFPALEAPDLMVKLLERATSPVSRTVEGETWSGVSRAYRLSPMVPGPVQVPAQELVITYAEPGRPEPLVARITLEPVTLTGVVPEGAEGLDRFLAATGLELTQSFSSETRRFVPGDSLTRTITVTVTGTSPLFVPTLLSPQDVPGMASYPAEPIVTETADRSWLSGTREESTTLVAESGGSGTLPPVEVTWFNLETGAVETARVEGIEISVDGPVARNRPDLDLRMLALWGLGAALVLLGIARAARWALPRARGWHMARKAAHEATESWAYGKLGATVQARDYAGFLAAHAVWRARLPDPGRADGPALRVAMAALGSCYFAARPGATEAAWTALGAALAETRAQAIRAAGQKTGGLAALNPV